MKYILSVVLLLMSVGTSYAAPGNIWGVHSDGSTDDIFICGEKVYLSGQNFEPYTTYKWDFKDVTNGEIVVKSGNVTNDSNGTFNMFGPIYTFPDNCGNKEYRIDLYYSQDPPAQDIIFCKKDSLETIPEFPTTALPVIMSLGGYIATRRRRIK